MAASKQHYGKIKKDITVMARIISDTFQDEDSCRGCRVHVKANYLAEQGAVFTIQNTSSGLERHGYTIIAPEAIEVIEAIEAIEGLEHLPQVVGDLLVDVAPMIEMGTRIEIHEDFFDDGESHFIIDRGTVRELRRQARDLELQMKDHEIELLHAEEGSRDVLEQSLRELEEAREKLEGERDGMNKKLDAARKEQNRKREKLKAERLRRETELLASIQNLTMQSFCDYGATLKNLPENEHVSVVFEQRRKDTSLVYVLKKNEVTKCNSDGTGLIKKALAYQF
jgi:hypothetical protein